jgi:hypothetical protein
MDFSSCSIGYNWPCTWKFHLGVLQRYLKEKNYEREENGKKKLCDLKKKKEKREEPKNPKNTERMK